MTRFRFWLVLSLAAALVIAGLFRLRLDAEVLNLLPPDIPAVQGLKIYQTHFSDSRELILTLRAPDADQADAAARAIAEQLRQATNLVSQVIWQPPWFERPSDAGELIGFLWFNQPPDIFAQLTNRLAPAKLVPSLNATRDQLATSMSPADIARLGFDPYGLTQLPDDATAGAASFGQGQELFSSDDGTFRVLFARAAHDLPTYRDCAQWLRSVKHQIALARAANQLPDEVTVNYTGSPVFVTEISSSMEHDMRISVGGTSVIIAILFWLAHRRWKPMLWLLALLAAILAGTLAIGGLIFGTINVVSMGFAAILLGLAVDYAVVHYQEALADPGLSIPEIRRAIAPSIFWAAVTTIAAFLVLNFGGLPGLAQLGSLVGLGVALSALVMIFAYLPPLFPERRRPRAPGSGPTSVAVQPRPSPPAAVPTDSRHRAVFAATAGLLLFCAITLPLSGFPEIDPTANALRPRASEAYTTLEEIQTTLSRQRETLWLVIEGRTENDVARRLDEIEPLLNEAVSNQVISDFKLAKELWPRPEFQAANRSTAGELADRFELLRTTALAEGFTDHALIPTRNILETWRRAAAAGPVFWPTNAMSRWIFDKVTARTPTNAFTVGFLYPATKTPATASGSLATLAAKLPRDVHLSGWELLGSAILEEVKRNMWKLVVPMICLVLLSLWLAFHRWLEVLLSWSVLLLSSFCLLAIMQLCGWSWNLLNLMAVPLILGTGVDYSIFMQLALRRHHGDLWIAHRSVGRALLLCGATAIAGFGMLGLSSNAGMASLGQVCAVGIAGNMLIAVFLLPAWWRKLASNRNAKFDGHNSQPEAEAGSRETSNPSSLYRAEVWRFGLWLVRVLPRHVCIVLGCFLARIYWLLASRRRETVVENLLPVLNNDPAEARKKAKALFGEFAIKIVDLWRYEAGLPIERSFGTGTNWDSLTEAVSQKRGVLLLTPHLGNWEFGGPWLVQKGVPLHVITMAEPGRDFTELRRQSRARWNIETLVIGDDPFAFLEIIKLLESGATVALLIDRPPAATAVTVELFGRPFDASIAAAELARASGCILLPVYLPRDGDTYSAHVLPPIAYDRPALRDPAARHRLTQQVVSVFEPAIKRYPEQWYHFIPVWRHQSRIEQKEKNE